MRPLVSTQRIVFPAAHPPQKHRTHRQHPSNLNLIQWAPFMKGIYLSERQKALKHGIDDGSIYMTSSYFMCKQNNFLSTFIAIWKISSINNFGLKFYLQKKGERWGANSDGRRSTNMFSETNEWFGSTILFWSYIADKVNSQLVYTLWICEWKWAQKFDLSPYYRSHTLQADSADIMNAWIMALRKRIDEALQTDHKKINILHSSIPGAKKIRKM